MQRSGIRGIQRNEIREQRRALHPPDSALNGVGGIVIVRKVGSIRATPVHSIFDKTSPIVGLGIGCKLTNGYFPVMDIVHADLST